LSEIDTGFEDVLAGEVYVAPQEKPQPEQVTGFLSPQQAERLPTSDAAEPVTTLTEDGKQAAKALISLPNISQSDLARLARDIAMDIKERYVVLKDHGLTPAQYDYLETYNEFYKNALQAACIEWHAPLSTAERIKIEAQAILEDSLLDLGARMRNKSEGLPGVVEAAKFFGKIAGVGEREVGSGPVGERFVINIDLGGDTKVTVSSGDVPTKSSQTDSGVPLLPDIEVRRPFSPVSKGAETQGGPEEVPAKPKGT
jgi:hypothetical protein